MMSGWDSVCGEVLGGEGRQGEGQGHNHGAGDATQLPPPRRRALAHLKAAGAQGTAEEQRDLGEVGRPPAWLTGVQCPFLGVCRAAGGTSKLG